MKKILITGAAGNLGGLLAKYLSDEDLHLNLMYHKKAISKELTEKDNISIYKVDLNKKESIKPCLQGVDTIIHFAGILFKSNPEKFLPITNTLYFSNLIEAAIKQKVKRVILISFPHVEGETNPDSPTKGIINGNPISMHAKTRLEEEILLFKNKDRFEAVSLRLGMVYGKGILMIDTAKWFAKHRILGIWKKTTWIHLISTIDYLLATKNAILKDNIKGIYHIGDDGIQTLQEFLDDATKKWGYRKPVRMNKYIILFVAKVFEICSLILRTRSPLTRDFIKIGMISYYGDTSRMKEDLLPELKYKTYKEGINTL
jgi:nucleoside-diphosphate-sugar epimerase